MATATADIEITVKEFELYAEGLYVAEIQDAEKSFGQFGEQLKFKFYFPDIQTDSGDQAYLSYYTSYAANAKSKLGKMFLACGKAQPAAGSQFKIGVLLNEWVQARVTHYMRTDGSAGCKITDLLPLTPKQRKDMRLAMPEPVAETPKPAPQAAVPPAVETPADESLPRMRSRKSWELLARKGAVVDVNIGSFPSEETDARIAEQIASLKKFIQAKEEEAENEEIDPFSAE